MSTSPIHMFFGPESTGTGPFGVLGLPPEPCAHERVLEALRARLDRVDQHAMGDTEEGDEVRLALHAAAAQLMDPSAQRRAVQRFGTHTQTEPHRESLPSPSRIPTHTPRTAEARATSQSAAPVKHAVPQEMARLERDAMMLLARFGGWNRRSLERLAWVAHARGVPSDRLTEALHHLLGQSGAQQPSATAPEALQKAAVSAPAAPSSAMNQLHAIGGISAGPEPLSRAKPIAWGWWLVSGGVLLVAMALVLVLVPAGPDVPVPQPAEPAPASAARPAEPELFPAPPAHDPEPVPESASLLRRLGAAVGSVTLDPNVASDRMVEIVDQLGQEWTRQSPDRRGACIDQVIEYLYRAPPGTGANDVVDAIAARTLPTSTDPASAAWGAGVLVRLSRETELDASILARVERSLAGAFSGNPPGPGSFVGGAVAMLGVRSSSLFTGNDAVLDSNLASWLSALDAALGPDEPARQDLMLRALESLLAVGPDPRASEPADRALHRLVRTLSWREGAPSRGWLVRALRGASIATSDMSALTSVLASRSGAPGVGPLMVLPQDADERQRRDLAQQFAQAWDLNEGGLSGEVFPEWLERAQEAVAVVPDPTGVEESMTRAVQISALNASARAFWQDRLSDAADGLAIAERLDAHGSGAGSGGTGNPVSYSMPYADRWAIEYLGAGRHIPVRLDLIERIDRTGRRLHPLEAEVLVNEALWGTPIKVRSAAYGVVAHRGGEAVVVNAMLEALPIMPPTQRGADLAGRLCESPAPSVSRPDWRATCRRMLADRLMALLAGESELARIDELLPEYAGSLLDRAHRAGDPSSEALDEQAAVQKLRRLWAERAGSQIPLVLLERSPDRVEAARVARLRLAEGPVQRFAVDQLAAAESMAFVVAHEQPQGHPEVERVLRRLREDRLEATNIVEQILAVERAMLRMWMIRLGEGIR